MQKINLVSIRMMLPGYLGDFADYPQLLFLFFCMYFMLLFISVLPTHFLTELHIKYGCGVWCRLIIAFDLAVPVGTCAISSCLPELINNGCMWACRMWRKSRSSLGIFSGREDSLILRYDSATFLEKVVWLQKPLHCRIPGAHLDLYS